MKVSDLNILGLENIIRDIFDIHEYIPDIDNFTAYEIKGYGFDKTDYIVYAMNIDTRGNYDKFQRNRDEGTTYFHLTDFDILEKSFLSGRLWLCNMNEFRSQKEKVPHMLIQCSEIQNVFYPIKEPTISYYAEDPEPKEEDEYQEKLFLASEHYNYPAYSLEIPSTCNTVSHQGFYDCKGLENIKKIIIDGDKNFTDDTGFPFASLTNIEEIEVKNARYLESEDGILYLNLDEEYFTYEFAETMDGMNMRSGKVLLCVPQNYHSQELMIPEGVTAIRHSAFFNCKNIESITLPNSLREIGICAFQGMTNLRQVYVPNHRVYINIELNELLAPMNFKVFSSDPLVELDDEIRMQWDSFSKLCSGSNNQEEYNSICKKLNVMFCPQMEILGEENRTDRHHLYLRYHLTNNRHIEICVRRYAGIFVSFPYYLSDDVWGDDSNYLENFVSDTREIAKRLLFVIEGSKDITDLINPLICAYIDKYWRLSEDVCERFIGELLVVLDAFNESEYNTHMTNQEKLSIHKLCIDFIHNKYSGYIK